MVQHKRYLVDRLDGLLIGNLDFSLSDNNTEGMMDLAKPFIQLFKTPRSQYVFDVNKNEMLPVSAESVHGGGGGC